MKGTCGGQLSLQLRGLINSVQSEAPVPSMRLGPGSRWELKKKLGDRVLVWGFCYLAPRWKADYPVGA